LVDRNHRGLRGGGGPAKTAQHSEKRKRMPIDKVCEKRGRKEKREGMSGLSSLRICAFIKEENGLDKWLANTGFIVTLKGKGRVNVH